MSDEIKWTLLVTGATLVTGFAARKILARGWSGIGGGTPPSGDRELDDTSAGKALLWSMAVAGAVAISRRAPRELLV